MTLKPAIKCYRTINGIRFVQWTDNTGSTKKEAQQALKREQNNNPNTIFILRKNKGFYRIYIREYYVV